MLRNNSIIKLYETGKSTRQIADVLGCSKTKVADIVKSAGISRDRSESQLIGCRRQTRIGAWRFLPLDKDKAWLLGLIYGDGSLRNDGYAVDLTSGDFDIIEKANNLLGGNCHIVKYPTYKVLRISSRNVWNDLVTLRLCPDKSSKLAWPEIKDELLPHFVRGLLDSDGCWTFDKRQGKCRLVFKYVSRCENFVKSLRNCLISNCQVSPYRNLHKTTNNAWEIAFSNKDAIQIGFWLYDSSSDSARGERKYSRWKSAL